MQTYQPKIEVITDSIFNGERLTTLVVSNFPKQLLQEANTHRQSIARNAASTRAVPVQKVIQQVLQNPYIPPFTLNRKGMTGNFVTDPKLLECCIKRHLQARDNAVETALSMAEDGIHKQDANTVLEPFWMVPWIVTGNNWDNFFNLRCSDAAKPSFKLIADGIKGALANSTPVEKQEDEWHIPFNRNTKTDVNGIEWSNLSLLHQIQIAIARIARVSYSNFYGTVDYEADLRLYNDLLRDGHLSPFEHVCKAYTETGETWFCECNNYEPYQYGSFWDLKKMKGNWVQFRHLLKV